MEKDVEKDVKKMTEQEINTEIKERSVWDSRYFELERELEERQI